MLAEILQGHRIIDQGGWVRMFARGHSAWSALDQQRMAAVMLLAIGQSVFLIALSSTSQSCTRFAIEPDGSIQRMIGAGQTAVHRDTSASERELQRDCSHILGRHVTFVDGSHLAFDLAQIEK